MVRAPAAARCHWSSGSGVPETVAVKRASAPSSTVTLSGWPAKVAARGYHLAALPRAANRWSIALAWAAEAVSERPLSRLGLVSAEESDFRTSEGIGDTEERSEG